MSFNNHLIFHYKVFKYIPYLIVPQIIKNKLFIRDIDIKK